MDHSLYGYLSRRTNQELERIILLFQQQDGYNNQEAVMLAREILNNRKREEQ